MACFCNSKNKKNFCFRISTYSIFRFSASPVVSDRLQLYRIICAQDFKVCIGDKLHFRFYILLNARIFNYIHTCFGSIVRVDGFFCNYVCYASNCSCMAGTTYRLCRNTGFKGINIPYIVNCAKVSSFCCNNTGDS